MTDRETQKTIAVSREQYLALTDACLKMEDIGCKTGTVYMITSEGFPSVTAICTNTWDCGENGKATVFNLESKVKQILNNRNI